MSTFNHVEIVQSLANLANMNSTARMVHLRNTITEEKTRQVNTPLKGGLTITPDAAITASGEDGTEVVLQKGDSLYLVLDGDEVKLQTELIFIYHGGDHFDCLTPSFAELDFDPATKTFSVPSPDQEHTPFVSANEILNGIVAVASERAKTLKEGEHLRIVASHQLDALCTTDEQAQRFAKSYGFYTGIEVYENSDNATLTGDGRTLEVNDGLTILIVIFKSEDLSDLRIAARINMRGNTPCVVEKFNPEDGVTEWSRRSLVADVVLARQQQQDAEKGITRTPMSVEAALMGTDVISAVGQLEEAKPVDWPAIDVTPTAYPPGDGSVYSPGGCFADQVNDAILPSPDA